MTQKRRLFFNGQPITKAADEYTQSLYRRRQIQSLGCWSICSQRRIYTNIHIVPTMDRYRDWLELETTRTHHVASFKHGQNFEKYRLDMEIERSKKWRAAGWITLDFVEQTWREVSHNSQSTFCLETWNLEDKYERMLVMTFPLCSVDGGCKWSRHETKSKMIHLKSYMQGIVSTKHMCKAEGRGADIPDE